MSFSRNNPKHIRRSGVSLPVVMKPFKNTLLYSSIALGVLFALPKAHAQNNIWTGTQTDDWNDSTNWNQGNVPNSGNTAVIRGDRTATINSAVPNTGFSVGFNGVGTLIIQAGGSLTTSQSGASANIGAANNNSGTGYLEMSGGYLQIGNGTSNQMWLGYSSSATTNTAVGDATISGGEFKGGMIIGVNDAGGLGSGTLTVVGDQATIGSTGNAANIFSLRGTGTVVFQLGATGVTKLNYANSALSIHSNAKMVLDLTSYTGGVGEIDLIDGSTITFGGGFDAWNTAANVSWVNPVGYTAALAYDATNTRLYLDITAIPEPGTAVLLLVSALGAGLLRRTRRVG